MYVQPPVINRWSDGTRENPRNRPARAPSVAARPMSALPGRRRSALGVMASLLIAGTLLGPAASGGRARAGGDRRIQVADQSEDRVYAADGPTIQLARAGYRLEANPLSTLVTVESPRGALYTRFPLLMLNGTATLPPGSHRSLALTGGSLVATLEDAQG
ncbi:MAG: hypothetical protein ACREPA_09285, partial [Candidatus Dormibacteraceae bacterium]